MPRATFDAFASTSFDASACRGHEARSAHALAIEPEVLRARRHDDDFRQPRGHEARAVRVLVEPFGETLIREVDERHETALLAELRQRFPLLVREIGAARVVTAAVNQHELAGLRLVELADHRVEVHAVVRVVVVRVGLELEARHLQQRNVVRPRRVADVHARVRLAAREQMPGDAQAAAAARRLHGRHATGFERRMILAVQQLRNAGVETRVARDRHVGLAVLRVEDRLLRAFDAREHGRAALLVLVDANGEVDLAGMRVRAEQGHDPQDRVRRQRLQCFEHNGSSRNAQGAPASGRYSM